jgi:hypothetical protein
VKTLVVCSGGLDSATLTQKVAVDQTVIHLAPFDYGHRQRRELEYLAKRSRNWTPKATSTAPSLGWRRRRRPSSRPRLNSKPVAGKALIAFLASSTAAPVLTKSGLEPVATAAVR